MSPVSQPTKTRRKPTADLNKSAIAPGDHVLCGGTFAAFLSTKPDMEDFARRQYLALDRAAVRNGEAMKLEHPGTDVLRARAADYESNGLHWLAAKNRDLADALDIDPRLAAVEGLHSWARGPGGCGQTFVNWYAALLREHIAAVAATLPLAEQLARSVEFEDRRAALIAAE